MLSEGQQAALGLVDAMIWQPARIDQAISLLGREQDDGGPIQRIHPGAAALTFVCANLPCSYSYARVLRTQSYARLAPFINLKIYASTSATAR